MFLASKQEETELPDFGECSTGFIKYHGTFQTTDFRIAPAYDKACLHCRKIYVFPYLLLQFGNATCRSLMAFILPLQQWPALTHSSCSSLQKCIKLPKRCGSRQVAQCIPVPCPHSPLPAVAGLSSTSCPAAPCWEGKWGKAELWQCRFRHPPTSCLQKGMLNPQQRYQCQN